jgi:hypothetical protein
LEILRSDLRALLLIGKDSVTWAITPAPDIYYYLTWSLIFLVLS